MDEQHSHQLILKRYRPLEILGRGGFGEVVLAWDTRMQRRVAIKRLPLPADSDARLNPRGLAEARTAAMLGHPGIVAVYDFDTDSDEAFLVMEYVDGASLLDVLDAAEGPLAPEEAASVLHDVAAALAFAHNNGVLHLDLKPDNILITREGRAKVADFGIAELSSLAGHGPAWAGTPGYQPAEQLAGKDVTPETDEWALAMVACEMLSGVNPLVGRCATADPDAVAAFVPPALATKRSGLPPAVDEVLADALAADPEDRYERIADFAADLVELLGDPKAGRAGLAELVDTIAADDDEDEYEQGDDGLGFWDRVAGSLWFTLLVRTVAAGQAGWLVFAGLTPLGLEPGAQWAATALVSLGAALAPGLGMGLGLAALIFGALLAGLWIPLLLLVLIGVPWWWLLGRRDTAGALLPLAGPLLAFARAGLAQPLLAGFLLDPAPAALTGLLGGALTMLSSAALASALDLPVPHGLVATPAVWAPQGAWTVVTAHGSAVFSTPAAAVALAAWPLAALVSSMISGRATRLAGTWGAVAGSAVLAAGYTAAARVEVLTGSSQGYGSTTVTISLATSLILMVALASLGAPLRAEQDMPAQDEDEAPEEYER